MCSPDLIHNLFNRRGTFTKAYDQIHALNAFLNFPSKAFDSIHVAGTNGKGSVAFKIAKAYELTGKKVGLYSSPHISSFRERIRINQQLIPDKKAEHLIKQLIATIERENLPASFFDLLTMTAFCHFAEEKVDIAIIEVGIGGLRDSTNIINPQLSIITSIGFDHTQFLGNTIEKITYNKAGIIKRNTPVIIGPNVPRKIIEEVAAKQNAPLTCIEDAFTDWEQENQAIAKAAMEQLEIPPLAITQALPALPPCRFEIRKNGALILDCAHNPPAFTALFKRLQSLSPKKPLRIICGFSKEKELTPCLQQIAQEAAKIHLIQGNHQRALPVPELIRAFDALEISHYTAQPTIEATVKEALQLAKRNDERVLICGSFLHMGEVRAVLGIQEVRDPVNLNESFTDNPSFATVT